MKYATPGTISHGILKTEDLLDAFASELEDRIQDNAEAWCSNAGRMKRDALLAVVWDARECEDYDEADEILDALDDALQEFAPPGHYFGAHPADGSDFGYWPDENEDDGEY